MITRIASDGSATYDRQATFAAGLIMNSSLRLKSYTAAGLAGIASPVQGDVALCIDALAPTFLATVIGGGAIVTPVVYDGAAWKAF